MSKKNVLTGAESKPQPKTPREKFDEHYRLISDRDIMLDVLYEFKKANDLNQKTRENVKGLYNWLVVVPIIIIAFYMIARFLSIGL